jgi:hypothetical protein
MKNKTILPLAIIFCMLIGASCNKTKPATQSVAVEAFINPAIKGVDIPFTEFEIQAEKGDTLFYKSGSILIFPANSLVDKDGKLVTGKVKIVYREFSSPVDFFIAGIPMEYDSAGIKYTFESSGMCEINAYKDNMTLYINDKQRPEINLASNNSSNLHNLYYLDTAQKRWINKGKDVITDLKQESQPQNLESNNNLAKSIDNQDIVKPVKPRLANSQRYSFTITIEGNAFPELEVYNDLKFEVADDEKNFKPSDAQEDWYNVSVTKAKPEGTYWVTFKNAKRKATYHTYPVFEGKSYKQAMVIFEKKQKEYNNLLNSRISQEKKAALKRQREAEYQALLQKKKSAKQRFERLVSKRELDSINSSVAQMVYRTFGINNFGVWNCDHPLVLQSGISLNVHFKDEEGSIMPVQKFFLVNKNYNALFTCYSNQMTVLPNTQNMIWTMRNGKLIYLSYKDYSKYKISADTKDITLTLKEYSTDIKTIEDAKKAIASVSN